MHLQDIYDVWHGWQLEISSLELSRAEQRLRLMAAARRAGLRDFDDRIADRLLETTNQLGADRYGHVAEITPTDRSTTRPASSQRRLTDAPRDERGRRSEIDELSERLNRALSVGGESSGDESLGSDDSGRDLRGLGTTLSYPRSLALSRRTSSRPASRYGSQQRQPSVRSQAPLRDFLGMGDMHTAMTTTTTTTTTSSQYGGPATANQQYRPGDVTNQRQSQQSYPQGLSRLPSSDQPPQLAWNPQSSQQSITQGQQALPPSAQTAQLAWTNAAPQQGYIQDHQSQLVSYPQMQQILPQGQQAQITYPAQTPQQALPSAGQQAQLTYPSQLSQQSLPQNQQALTSSAPPPLQIPYGYNNGAVPAMQNPGTPQSTSMDVIPREKRSKSKGKKKAR